MDNKIDHQQDNQNKTKILIVDDHPIVCDGLVRLISKKADKDLTICGQASNANDALKLINELKPDMLMIDISLRGCNGLELTKIIRNQNIKLPILILSMHDESVYAERSLLAGANGYIMKNEPSELLLKAIRKVFRGGVYISENISSEIVRKLQHNGPENLSSPISSLSDRELETFNLLGQGKTTREIANELFISVKTVETHFARIKTKLNLMTFNELIVQAAIWVNRSN